MEFERLRALLQSFSGRQATATRAVIPALTLVSLGTVFRQEIREASELQTWLGIAALAMLAAATVFYLGRLLVDQVRGSLELRTAVVAAYYFLIEATRAIVLELSAATIEPYPEVNLPHAIWAGGLTGVAFFGIASIILNDAQDYRARFQDVLSIRSRIENSIETSKSAIRTKRLEIANQISLAVDESLQKVLSIAKPKKDQALDFANELISISENVVRPLSHRVYQGNDESVTSASPSVGKVKLFRIIELIPITSPFRAWPLVLITIVLSLPTALLDSSRPMNAFLSLVIISVWFWFWLEMLNRYLLPTLRKLGLFTQWFLMLFGLVLMPAFPIAFFIVADERDLPEVSGLVSYIFIVCLVVGLAISTYPALEKARAELIQEAASANQSLAWHLSRLGSVLRIEERNLARTLHKDVQGALVASALRLQESLGKKGSTSAAIKRIKSDLAKSVAQLVEPEKPVELKKYLKNLNAGWSPVFKVSMDISSELLNKINADEICLASVTDLLGEFATNSVKHGASSKGEVKFQLIKEDVVRLTFENNGKPLPKNPKIGLGTQITMSLVLDARHEPLENGVRFSVDLAIESGNR